MKAGTLVALASGLVLLGVRPGAAQQTGPFPLAPSPDAMPNRVAQFGTVQGGVATAPGAPSTVVPPAIPQRPFSNYQAPPALSPWFGLYQRNFNIGVPNYYEYVRPLQRQQQLNQDIQQQQRSLQDLQTTAQVQQQSIRAGETAGQVQQNVQDKLATVVAGQQAVIQANQAGESVPDKTVTELNRLAKDVLRQLEEERNRPKQALDF